MATDKYEIDVDYTKLSKAIDELGEAIRQFNEEWNKLPLLVRIVYRLKLFVSDVDHIRETFMKQFYEALKFERKRNVQKD